SIPRPHRHTRRADRRPASANRIPIRTVARRACEPLAKEARGLRRLHSRSAERRLHVRRWGPPVVRSLRTTIVFKCAVTLGFCLGALVIGSAYAKQHPDPRGELLAQTLEFQFDVA